MDTPPEQTIHKMDDILASQVAAGEVVERPASVIKELVENSIDAGAKVIRVEIRRGGVAGIKVTDNGRGMSRADLGVCLQRHATSKLKSFDDLYNISQMGFRGEALPSIASVAHIRISTRRPEDVEGSLLVAHGGVEEDIVATGCPPGTEIEVQELFYNIPARRQFLKSMETESGHIEHQLRLHALAFPEIRFTFVRDGQVIFDVAATHDLRQRIAEFTDRAFAEKLLRMRPTTEPGVRVEGFLTPLSEARRNRKQQYIFLNNRPIEDKNVLRAVRDGFGGFPTGLHPGLFLYLTIEPALVDVNVHPAKREVRFRKQADVTTAIINAVSATLADHARGLSQPPPALQQETAEKPSATPTAPPPTPAPHHPAPAPILPRPSAPEPSTRPAPALRSPARASQAPLHTNLRLETEPHQPDLPLPAPPRKVSRPAEDTPPFRLLGVIRSQYILFENNEGLVLLSVRAARERIIFERLMESDRRRIVSQALIAPVIVEPDVRQMGIAIELQPMFVQAGFQISVFGDRALRVDALPPYLELSEVDAFVLHFIDTFSSGESRLRRKAENPFRPFAVQMAREAVRKENMNRWLNSPVSLLSELLRCENPYCTALGKPTMLPFPMSEIQRKFQAQ